MEQQQLKETNDELVARRARVLMLRGKYSGRTGKISCVRDIRDGFGVVIDHNLVVIVDADERHPKKARTTIKINTNGRNWTLV